MQPLTRYGASALRRTTVARVIGKGGEVSMVTRRAFGGQRSRPWVCLECRTRKDNAGMWKDRGDGLANSFEIQRAFSTQTALRDEGPARPDQATTGQDGQHPSSTRQESLPSQTAHKRWDMSKKWAKIMDQVLARASTAGHQINTFTGTDYSGIEALRGDIAKQETEVKEGHKLVEEAKGRYSESHAKQSASQKEVVALLERKSNWTPTDLERYMSLIRSEHLNEQDVQAARDDLAASERRLDDARSLLERLERKQYHEEQIWSDTIRRNSTWVTFGLMGVNIVLLLAQLLVFEPYRRRKIVNQVKSALDERSLPSSGAATVVTEAEKQVDEVVEPAGAPVEVIESAVKEEVKKEPSQPIDAIVPEVEDAGQSALAAGEVLPEEATEVIPEPAAIEEPVVSKPPHDLTTWTGTWQAYQESFQDLFSERVIQIKKADITTIALEGAAAGVAVMGLIFVLLRPK